MATLLVIDDDPEIQLCFQAAFRSSSVTLRSAGTAGEGLELLDRDRPEVVVLDIQLPDDDGLKTFRRIHDRDPRIPVIFITSRGTAETAIEAMRLGAYEYLLKPLDLEHTADVVGRALAIARLMARPAVVPELQEVGADMLIGRCQAMQEVYKSIGRVAPQDVTVLLRGESGTGKELVARAIYTYSRRATAPFLAINCAAIPETLLESELFGHEKGAFTGASQRRIGKFEQCNGGTLFLDEIGDMSPVTQVKVLRVLQEQHFQRVGGNELIQANVRIIAATNRDLERMVSSGQFRNDLYYRLNVYSLMLPPLRDRRDDIPVLLHYYLRRFGRELSKEVVQITQEVVHILEDYDWPGNVRELQSILKQALLQATGPVLVPEFLPSVVLKGATPGPRPPAPVHTLASLGGNSGGENGSSFGELTRFIEDRLQAQTQNLYDEYAARTEGHLFKLVLQHSRGNLTQAARVLGINRGTLRTKLAALGMKEPPQS